MDRNSAYYELLERYRPMVWRLCWRHARGGAVAAAVAAVKVAARGALPEEVVQFMDARLVPAEQTPHIITQHVTHQSSRWRTTSKVSDIEYLLYPGPPTAMVSRTM